MKRVLSITGCTVALALSVQTAAADHLDDSSDHPILSRFAGAEIVAHYNESSYDEIKLPSGPITNWKNPENVLELEGRVVFHSYLAPEGKSALEIGRNYEKALEEGGFDVLFACEGSGECGKRLGFYVRHLADDFQGVGGELWRGPQDHDPEGRVPSMSLPSKTRAYLAARTDDSITDHVFLLLEPARDYEEVQSVAIYQVIVEGDPVATDQVETGVRQADELEQTLRDTGKVEVPGIFFDFDRAGLRPESSDALEQMAALMNNTDLEVIIAGHTDDQGGDDYNMDLSERRAQAVRSALIDEYGIASTRMSAEGFGLTESALNNC